MDPANSAATPATSTLVRLASEAATPTIKLAVETMPSFAPRTAARSQPMRDEACRSKWVCEGLTRTW